MSVVTNDPTSTSASPDPGPGPGAGAGAGRGSSGLEDVSLPSVYNATAQPVQQVHTQQGTSVPVHVINIPQGPGPQHADGITEPGEHDERRTKDEAVQTSPSASSRVVEALSHGFNKVVDAAEVPVEYVRQASNFLGNGILDVWDETINTFKHGFNPTQQNNNNNTNNTTATQPGASTRTDPLDIQPPVLSEITTDGPPTATNSTSQTAYANTPAFVIDDPNQGIDTTQPPDIPIPESNQGIAIPHPVE